MPKFSSHYAGLAEGDLDGPALDARYAPIAGDDEAYGAGWNGDTTYPTKNAVYDKVETLSAGGGETFMFVSPKDMRAFQGAPADSRLTNCPAWLMDASATESLQFSFMVPSGWATFTVKAMCANNAGGGSGDVVLDLDWGEIGVGDAVLGTSALSSVTATASAATIRFDVTLATLTNSGGGLFCGQFLRLGTNVADTLANDLAFLGFLLEQAS